MKDSLQGYRRSDGRKGIRNYLIVAYLVECAHHVAREIVAPFRDEGVQLIGFGGCYPNDYAFRMMQSLCTHPNVGGVLLLSLGCESFERNRLAQAIAESDRPANTLVIQECGGTRSTIEKGREWVSQTLDSLKADRPIPMTVDELVVGTICGGSDATSVITANPGVGRAFDQLVEAGAAAIFEETGELIGCESILEERAVTPMLGHLLRQTVEKAAHYYQILGSSSFASGNAEGGLTTIEEKSLGAYSKSGRSPISGLLKPGDQPPVPGLYLLDIVPDGEVRFGFPNINDSVEISELIACGAHLILFTTGRGSVVGSAVSPVIKVCANPETYGHLREDMDVNAGRVLEGAATIDEIGEEIFKLVCRVASGHPTVSEALGHQEFALGYKHFEPLGPGCHPGVV